MLIPSIDLMAGRIVQLVQGEKKALAGMQAGIPTIGLVGVWGWQCKRKRTDQGQTYGERQLLPPADDD